MVGNSPSQEIIIDRSGTILAWPVPCTTSQTITLEWQMRNSNRLGIALAIIVVANLAACKLISYKVELTPDGPAMDRILTRPFGPERLDELAAIYGVTPDPETLALFEDGAVIEFTLSSRFTAQMPNDTDNVGYLLHCESPMGSSSVYTERFGGRDDVDAILEDREYVFHRIWDALLMMLEHLVGTEPGFSRLKSVLDTDVRHDAWNLLLALSITDIIDNSIIIDGKPVSADHMATMARVAHYLDARGYMGPDDYKSLYNYVESDSSQEEFAWWIRTIGRAIWKKMGLPQHDRLPQPLARLATYSFEHLGDEMEEFVESSAVLAAAVSEWQHNDDRADPTDITPEDYIGSLFDRVGFDAVLFSASRDLDVVLHLPVEPLESSGRWNDEGFLEWNFDLAYTDFAEADLPNIVYAWWAEPNVDYQVAHFGEVVIEDEELSDFCLWYEWLPERHASEWDAFVRDLTPEPGLANKLRGFLFSHESYDSEVAEKNLPQSDIAGDVIGNIVSALDKE